MPGSESAPSLARRNSEAGEEQQIADATRVVSCSGGDCEGDQQAARDANPAVVGMAEEDRPTLEYPQDDHHHQRDDVVGGEMDVADAALFLASEQASFITGQTLIVDGGYSIFG